MKRYAVWHSTGKFDGDSTHDTLAQAKAEFDHQRSRRGVTHAELSENTEDGPVVIQSWNAVDVGNPDPDPCTL